MNWKLFTRELIGRILRLVKVKAVLLYTNFKLT